MKKLFRNCLVVDGTGLSSINGSVAVDGDKIIAVNENIEESGFDEVIDLEGNVLCPGFIDTHSHSDLEVFKNPHLTPKVMQGITTEVLGQDGVSLAPLPVEFISPWRKNIAGLNGDSDDLDWTFRTTDNYLKMMEKNGTATNQCYLIPHGNVRMEAMGLDNRLAGPEELAKMRKILERELDAGGFGLSTGLIYVPCAYSNTEEVTELCKISAKYDRPLVIHQRSEADSIIESMNEVISIGRDSGVWVHFSHFKVCGKNNAHLFDGVLALLDQAEKEGIRVSFDQYPYNAGSTMLGVILPPWAHDGGTDKLLERLADSDARVRMTNDINKGIHGWDNFVEFAGLDGIFITSVVSEKNQNVIGKNLIELGIMRDKAPLEATFDLLLEENNAVGMVDFYGLEEHIRALIIRPEQNVCTDGLLGGKPHPRVYGAFPRVLGKYVREEKLISLEEAVRKMTSRPADVFGIKNRGLLKEGYKADLTVFNPETIGDRGTYEDPRQFPDGIIHVLVNGEFVVRDSEPIITSLPGRVLRR